MHHRWALAPRRPNQFSETGGVNPKATLAPPPSSSFHNRTSGSKIKCPAGFQREDGGKVDGLKLFYVLWNRVYFQSLEIGKIFSKQEHKSMFEINPASGGISSGSDVDREVLGHPSLASHAVLARFSPVESPCLLYPFYC